MYKAIHLRSTLLSFFIMTTTLCFAQFIDSPRLIEKYENDTLDFLKLDASIIEIHWDLIGTNLSKRGYKKLYKKALKKKIVNIENARFWLNLNLHDYFNGAFPTTLGGAKYKAVEDGFLIWGEISYNSDIILPYKVDRHFCTFLVGYNKEIVTVRKDTIEAPPLYVGAVSIDTTYIKYYFPEGIEPDKCIYPSFVTGIEGLAEYISKELHYPDEAVSLGKVIVSFMINPDSSITQMKILWGIEPQIDKEVIQFVESTSGKWIPAKLGEENIASTMRLGFIYETIKNKAAWKWGL